MMTRSTMDGLIHGINICLRVLTISHLLFAYNHIIFSRATCEEAMHILQILEKYETTSGQKINLHKSGIFYNCNVSTPRIDKLTKLLKFKAVDNYGKYLGLPTIVGRSKNQIFNFVREKMWKELNC